MVVTILGLTLTVPFLIFFIAGIALVIVEMFTPGFGISGVTGIVLLVISVILLQNLWNALVMTLFILCLLCVMLFAGMRSAAKGRLWRSPLVLKTSLSREEGYTGTSDMEVFLGQTGETRSSLRPAGVADFNGIRLDVVSEAEFIPSGIPVRIVQVEGRRIVVRRVSEIQSDSPSPAENR